MPSINADTDTVITDANKSEVESFSLFSNTYARLSH